jgi:aminobutyraldehyde dehydrogenase
VLAAGNTVVLKPSEQTPLTALRLAELASELFPRGVINIVCGRGESVGAPLVEHPLVRMVSLTGDIATGQKILQSAARTMKRTHLELGGKAPVIIFDDADLRPWWPAFAPSASTTPARIAPPPAASMPRARSTTSSSPP